MFSCQINTPSVFHINQHYRCLSTNNCRRFKSFIESRSIRLSTYVITIFTHLGSDYIRPNHSYLYSSKHQQKLLKQEHKNIKNIITSYLLRVHHISNSSSIIKQFIQGMETRLYQRYMAPL